MGVLKGKHLTGVEVARYAYNAGIRNEEALAIAVAIAYYESRWWTEALNLNSATGDASYGLWQINTIGAIWAERKERYNLSAKSDLYKPAVNAEIMFDLSHKGTKWTAWGAYTNGHYKQGLADARKAVKELLHPAPAKPKVSLAAVVYGATHAAADEKKHPTYKADVLVVQKALVAKKLLAASYADGIFGTATKTAYAKFQKSLGYSGSDADGVPGSASLSKLLPGYTVV